MANLNLAATLNKLRANDPDNAKHCTSIVSQPDPPTVATDSVRFMIDLCLRRRGWIPVFMECLASTPDLYQTSHTSNALDPPVVHLVLKEILDYNQQQGVYDVEETFAREACLLQLVTCLLAGLTTAPLPATALFTIPSVHAMDSLSLIQHVVLPCLRPDHPHLRTGLLLVQLALGHWNNDQSTSVVAIMLKSSLAELMTSLP